MYKYDKVLSQLLAKFYTDATIKPETRRIIQETINAEMSKLDRASPRGILQEIHGIIEKEAENIIQKK
jgi:hypothetical protein